MTSTKNIYQKLASVMEEVSYIQKEHKQGMSYRIVSHDAVTAKVRPALLKHGVVYHPIRCEHTHNGNRAECAMTVRFVNIDAPTDFFDVPTFGYGIDTQDKGPGKAMSYAVKYALLKALGLETGDDPDTESVEHKQEDPALPPPPTFNDFLTHITNAKTIDGLQAVFAEAWRSSLPKSDKDDIKAAYEQKKAELAKPADLSKSFVPADFDSLQSEHHGDRA